MISCDCPPGECYCEPPRPAPVVHADGWREPDVDDSGDGRCRGCGTVDDCFCNEWMFE